MFNFVFIYVSDAANLCFVTFVANDFEEKTFILSRETAKESETTVKIKKEPLSLGYQVSRYEWLIIFFFLFLNQNICFGYSSELSQ